MMDDDRIPEQSAHESRGLTMVENEDEDVSSLYVIQIQLFKNFTIL